MPKSGVSNAAVGMPTFGGQQRNNGNAGGRRRCISRGGVSAGYPVCRGDRPELAWN